MVDTVTTQSATASTVPSGTVIATDEVTIGGTLQQVQRVKLVDGTDGGTALIGGDASNGLDVDVTRLPAGEIHLGEVGGRSRVLTANFSRPGDTNTYTIGDAVTNSTSAPVALSVSGAARNTNGSGTLLAVDLVTSVAPTLKGLFEAWIFAGTSAPTAQNDNTAFAPADSALQSDLIAVVPLNVTFVGDSGSTGNVVYRGDLPNPRPYQCGSGVTTLWILTVTRNAYVPANAERFDYHLHVILD